MTKEKALFEGVPPMYVNSPEVLIELLIGRDTEELDLNVEQSML